MRVSNYDYPEDEFDVGEDDGPVPVGVHRAQVPRWRSWVPLLAILIIKWVGYTRLARSVVMQEKAKDYLMVSTISGASTVSIMRRHLLPHIVGPVMALATVDIGKVILLVASLSYLGLGVQLPSAEWGAMLNEAQMFFTQAPHLMVAPGLSIFLVVCAANWLGDQLQSLYAISGERKEETGVAA